MHSDESQGKLEAKEQGQNCREESTKDLQTESDFDEACSSKSQRSILSDSWTLAFVWIFAGLLLIELVLSYHPKPTSIRQIVKQLNELNSSKDLSAHSRKELSDLHWYKHFLASQNYLERNDIDQAEEEADKIIAIADALHNVMPQGPKTGFCLNPFDLSMQHLATAFECQPSEIGRTFSDPPLFESVFFADQIKNERMAHFAYSERLLKKAIQYGDATGDYSFYVSNLEHLSKCLAEQGKTEEQKAVMKALEEAIEREEHDQYLCKRIESYEKQAKLLESQGRLSEAELKLKIAITDAENREDLSSKRLDRLLKENTEAVNKKLGVSCLNTCSALQALGDFYQRTGQDSKEQTTLSELYRLERQTLPEHCWIITRDCARLKSIQNAAPLPLDNAN